MEAHGITDRDAFLAHAIGFDADDNNYLNKGELTAAAEAWSEGGDEESAEESEDGGEEITSEDSEEVTSEEESEDDGEDSESEEESAADDGTEELVCEICGAKNPVGSPTCPTCGFVFS
ncbi:MAG: hypothetical protein CMB49_02440 [Euryarchaeota archaeon]|nr:hypothetical protein [Euryarchaeota archaeon]